MELSLEDRLISIERRLTKIESTLKPPAQHSPPLSNGIPAPRSVSLSLSPESAPPTFNRANESEPVPDTSEAKPGNWLGISAVICFVLAACLIIKLSIDSGWLTPERQLGMAAALGFILIVAGFRLVPFDIAHASLLPGAGVIVLYLTAFAAHAYYDVISFENAIAFTAVVSAICIWLYTRIRHDVYPITAAVGAYLAPAVLGLHDAEAFSLYYFLICSFAFATISIWVKSRMLTMISAYLAIAVTALLGFNHSLDRLIAMTLAIHFIVFTFGATLYSLHNRTPLSEQEAYCFLPVLLAFYAAEYYFISRINSAVAPWISLGFAGTLIGLYLTAKHYFSGNLGSQSLILAFVTLVCFHSIYLELLPADLRVWLFVVIMLAYAFTPIDAMIQRNQTALFVPKMAALAIVIMEYVTMLGHLLHEHKGSLLPVSLAAIASIWMVIVMKPAQAEPRRQYNHLLLGAAHILAVTALYRLTTDYGSLAVSAAWLAYAASVMVFAFLRKDEIMAKSALVVLSFAAAKALLYDAASAATIIRILCLLLTGAVLYGCGFLMRHIANWKRQSR